MPATATFGESTGNMPRVLPWLSGSLGSQKGMVVIHGAGRFDPGYEQPMVQEIQSRLGQTIRVLPVRYADVIGSPGGDISTLATTDVAALDRFQADFQNEMVRDAFLRAFGSVPTPQLLTVIGSAAISGGNLLALIPSLFGAARAAGSVGNFMAQIQRLFPALPISDWLGKSMAAPAMGGLDLTSVIREVGLYLLNGQVRDKIQSTLKTELDQASQIFDDIVLVSHSLGTLVAFDVLHDLANVYDKISYWVTLGCPLSKVQRLGHRNELGQISRQTVRRWFNIYDTTDIVANAIGPIFQNNEYFLYDIFVDVAKDPLPSHDYTTNPETLDILAALMK